METKTWKTGNLHFVVLFHRTDKTPTRISSEMQVNAEISIDIPHIPPLNKISAFEKSENAPGLLIGLL